MFDLIGFTRAVYLACIEAFVYEWSDASSILRYDNTGAEIQPFHVPGC